MIPASIRLPSFANIRVRTKFLSLVIFMVLLAAATGGAGLYFVNQIEHTISDLTAVSSPLVKETTGLIQDMDQINLALFESLGETDADSHDRILGQLDRFQERFQAAMGRLEAIAEQGALELNLQQIVASQGQFSKLAREMLIAHQDQEQKKALAIARVQDFDASRKQLESAITALSKRYEEKMSEQEDGIKTLIQSGDAILDDIHMVLEDTFNQAYPIIRGSYALMGYLMQLQDITREYVASTDPQKIAALEKEYQNTLKKATKRLKRIQRRVRDAKSKDEAKAIANGLSQLTEIASKDGGLFTIYKASLQADNAANALLERLHGTSGDYKERLREVAAIAESLNRDSEQVTTSVVRQSKLSIGLVVLAGALVGLLMGILLVRSFTKPILNAVKVAETMSHGDFTIEIGGMKQDEVGTLLKALQTMKQSISKTLHEVQQSAITLVSTSEETSVVTEQTRKNAQEQQAAMQQAATATNQMLQSIQEVSGNTSRAADAARKVNADVGNGRQVVQQTIESINKLAAEVTAAGQVIHDLAAQTDNIGSVLDVIRGIAEQTNLLALNAAIEAARAGEQGRGFAVVADEVRTLASRTHESTQEIQEMIEQLQAGSSRAVQVMDSGRKQADLSVQQADEAGRSLTAISEASDLITDMNTQIAGSTEEQFAVAEEINRNITSIQQMVEQTATGANEVARASTGVAQQASHLQGLMDKFRL